MRTYIIAGGGTGGHIYPGIAIARSLQSLDPECRVVFVGTSMGLESKIVPKEGFHLETIKVGKLNHGGSIFSKLRVVIALPIALFHSLKLLQKYKPTAVLGVGGYASGPFVLVASLAGYPCGIWEANSHPGLTNRWLARFVRKAYVVFDDARVLLKSAEVIKAGLPVRKEIETPKPILSSSDFRILIFGGSQGARAINRAIVEALEIGGTWLENVRIVHQTGSLDYQDLKKRYEVIFDRRPELKNKIEVHEFLFDMADRYANADLVICRGGASTVTELAACGKASIIIPLPTAADNHQQKNAETLVHASAGQMILQKDLHPQYLIEAIEKLKKNPESCVQMSSNIRKLFIPRAAEKMAQDMMQELR